MNVLLLAEVNGGALSVDSTAKALTAAKRIGDVTILCVGNGCSDAANTAAKLDGVSKVLCAEDEAYGHDMAEPVSDLIVSFHLCFQKYLASCCSTLGCYDHLRSYSRY